MWGLVLALAILLPGCGTMLKRSPIEEVKDLKMATVPIVTTAEPAMELPAPQPYQQEEVPVVPIRVVASTPQPKVLESTSRLPTPTSSRVLAAEGPRGIDTNLYPHILWDGETTTVVSKAGDTVAEHGRRLLPEWDLPRLAGTFCVLNQDLMPDGCNEESFRRLPAGVEWVFPTLQKTKLSSSSTVTADSLPDTGGGLGDQKPDLKANDGDGQPGISDSPAPDPNKVLDADLSLDDGPQKVTNWKPFVLAGVGLLLVAALVGILAKRRSAKRR